MTKAPGLSNPSSVTIAVLVAIAAAIHFSRAAVDPDIRVLFMLNGLGFLVLGAGALFVRSANVRRWSERILIGYAGVTLALYLVWAALSGDWVFPWGPLAGVVEVVLIWLLIQARARRAPRTTLPG